MENVIRKLLSVVMTILALFSIGTADGFELSVKEAVTTETTKITVVGHNRTGVIVGVPRVDAIEKLEGDEWVEVAGYEMHTEEYFQYYPLGIYKEAVTFKNIGMEETIPEGEYRVAVSFILKPTAEGTVEEIGYAYFTVTAP